MMRPLALTMPAVTVWPRPKGLPMASTHSPTSRFSELPNGTVGRGSGLLTRSSARSVLGSRPIRVASNSSFDASVTVISSASSTTWLLVTM